MSKGENSRSSRVRVPFFILILIFGFFFLSFIYQGVCSCCPGLVFIDK